MLFHLSSQKPQSKSPNLLFNRATCCGERATRCGRHLSHERCGVTTAMVAMYKDHTLLHLLLLWVLFFLTYISLFFTCSENVTHETSQSDQNSKSIILRNPGVIIKTIVLLFGVYRNRCHIQLMPIL